MKKTVLIIIIVLLILALIAGAVVYIIYQTREDELLIGEERAQHVALTDADLDVSQVSKLKIKLVYDDGGWFYKVEFKTHALEYEYMLDAYSGAIIEKDIDD